MLQISEDGNIAALELMARTPLNLDQAAGFRCQGDRKREIID
jgi:hypothetical protein